MAQQAGGNTKTRGEWSGWLLAAVCALLLAAPAQSTPLNAPQAFHSFSCAGVLAWLQESDEVATLQARREAVLHALCEAGALDRHEAETLLSSLQTTADSSDTPASSNAAFITAQSTLPSSIIAPREVEAHLIEYSLSPHEAAFLSGVRTNRWLK